MPTKVKDYNEMPLGTCVYKKNKFMKFHVKIPSGFYENGKITVMLVLGLGIGLKAKFCGLGLQ